MPFIELKCSTHSIWQRSCERQVKPPVTQNSSGNAPKVLLYTPATIRCAEYYPHVIQGLYTLDVQIAACMGATRRMRGCMVKGVVDFFIRKGRFWRDFLRLPTRVLSLPSNTYSVAQIAGEVSFLARKIAGRISYDDSPSKKK